MSRAEDPSRPVGPDRRDVLKKLGVGAAVAWTTPMVLQSAASAARGTCYPQFVNWQDDPTLQPGPSSLGQGWIFPYNIDSVAVGIPGYTGIGGPPSAPIDVIWNDQSLGGVPAADQLTINLQANAIGDFEDIELDFGTTPVYGLTFTLYDIDSSASNWSDEIRVYAENGVGSPTNPVPTTAVPFGSTVTINSPVGGGPGGAPNGVSLLGDGTGPGPGGSVPNTDDFGNVTLTWAPNEGVTKVTIRYTAFGQGTQPQQVGLGNLQFCAYLP